MLEKTVGNKSPTVSQSASMKNKKIYLLNLQMWVNCTLMVFVASRQPYVFEIIANLMHSHNDALLSNL